MVGIVFVILLDWLFFGRYVSPPETVAEPAVTDITARHIEPEAGMWVNEVTTAAYASSDAGRMLSVSIPEA